MRALSDNRRPRSTQAGRGRWSTRRLVTHMPALPQSPKARNVTGGCRAGRATTIVSPTARNRATPIDAMSSSFRRLPKPAPQAASRGGSEQAAPDGLPYRDPAVLPVLLPAPVPPPPTTTWACKHECPLAGLGSAPSSLQRQVDTQRLGWRSRLSLRVLLGERAGSEPPPLFLHQCGLDHLCLGRWGPDQAGLRAGKRESASRFELAPTARLVTRLHWPWNPLDVRLGVELRL